MEREDRQTVVVIGAGATGLAASYILRRAGVNVVMVEGAAQAGGLLKTFEVGNGHRLEFFYHHFFTHDAEIIWLLHELGLGERLVFRPTTMGIFHGGRVYPFNGPKDLMKFRAISILPRLRFGLSSALLTYWTAYAKRDYHSAIGWFRRWAGHHATEAIWRPMLEIKFGDAANRITLAWMAGRMRQRIRSRRLGEETLGYLDGSLQVLIDRLVEELDKRGVKIYLGSYVQRLIIENGRISGVATNNGPVHGDKVLSTIATPILAKLVRPISDAYADQLESVQYTGVISTIFNMPRQLSPVYWLNVADPGYDFGGVIEQTNFVGPEHYGRRHLVYLSRYIDTDHPLWTMGDKKVVDRQVRQLERLFGRHLKSSVDQSWVFRGRFAGPIWDIGFHRRIPTFKSPIPNLYVASMSHVYPDERSVNNSIRVAAEATRALGVTTAADLVPHGCSLAGTYGAD